MVTQLTSTDYRSMGFAFLRFILFVVIPPLIIIPLTNLIFNNPDRDDLKVWAKAAWETHNPKREKDALDGLIAREPLNPRYHYLYIVTHFKLPMWDKGELRDDLQLYEEYYNRTKSNDPEVADIGYFGLGVYCLQESDYEESLDWLTKVKNSILYSLHYQIGCNQAKLDRFKEAELSFRKEIENGGHIRGAVVRMAYLLHKQKKYEELNQLYKIPQTHIYFPNSIARKLHLHNGHLTAYLLGLLNNSIRNFNLAGFAGGFFITIVWLYFLKRLDIFEPEKSIYVFITLLLGMAAAFISSFFYDISSYYLEFDLDGRWVHDMLYCIFGIGFNEELVKVLPLLVMIQFSKQVNESIDFIIYASVGALGFSFMENLLYFQEYKIYIIDERGLFCVIGHMIYTALIGYGFILAKYGKKGTVIGNIIIFFLLACIIHGVYDFWFISDAAPKGSQSISIVLKLILVIIFNRMINNALNQSEFFDENSLKRLNYLREILGMSLMAIVMFEYVCLTWKYGPELSYAQCARSIGFTWFLVFFLSFNLTHYVVRKDKWVKLWPESQKAKK